MTRHPAGTAPVSVPPVSVPPTVLPAAPTALGDSRRARIAVLASGSGSNLQAILDAVAIKRLHADVVAVISDNGDAYALTRAKNAQVPTVLHHPRVAGCDRRAWDRELALLVKRTNADLVVLAGFLRILTSDFLNEFPGRVINLHPARPGELAGLHAIERAFDEFTNGTRHRSGVMVHLVPDEGVDSGPVLGAIDVLMCRDDTLEAFRARMHGAEHQLLVATLQQFIETLFPADSHRPDDQPTHRPADQPAHRPADQPAHRPHDSLTPKDVQP